MRLASLTFATLVLSGGMLLAQQTQSQPVTPDQNPTNNTVTTDPTRNATTNPTQTPGVQSQTSNPPQGPAAASSGQQTRIVGCVSGPLGGSYMLVANGKQYRLVGDYDNIREHVGQKVAITGSSSAEPANPATAESGPNSSNMPSSSNTTGATGTSTTTGPAEKENQTNVPSLNVSKVEMLAEHCDTAETGPEAGTSTVAPQAQVPPATATKGESSTTPVTEAPEKNESNTTPSEAQTGQQAGQIHSITGCLRKSPSGAADKFVLKNAGGNWTEVVSSDNNRQKLADHVDQQVRLSGEWSNATETAQAMPQSDQPSSQSSAAGQAVQNNGQFKVNRIDVISTSCSATSKEKEY